MAEEAWLKQIDLNLNSVYRLCHAVLPIMEKQGSGAVINNASITALRFIGKPQVSVQLVDDDAGSLTLKHCNCKIAYATAKAAVIQFTKATGVMYAPKGVRLNCVVPGLMFTPLVENLGQSNKPEDKEVFRKITEHNVPMGKMGESIDVANAAVFLCSNAAKYITAHALVVDGGITQSTGTGG
jgi:NAD(P)-dependent dehydrogenase (short-subunit alcohol dehydrogenase family)